MALPNGGLDFPNVPIVEPVRADRTIGSRLPTVPAMRSTARSSDPGSISTPLLPPKPPTAEQQIGTLTALSGAFAGQVWVVHGGGLRLGRASASDVAIDDSAVSRYHACVRAGPSGAYYVEDLGSTNGTYLGPERVKWAPLTSGDLIRLGPSFRLRFQLADEHEASALRSVYESSVRDPLTATFNRRYLRRRLEAETRNVREGADLALIMIDVDHMKHFNDAYGHLAGDRALCVVAQMIMHCVRRRDVVARYGGDEFVVLAPATSSCQAIAVANRVHQRLATRRFTARGSPVGLSVSIGHAAHSELEGEEASTDGLIALADARLYAAKRARAPIGRDCSRVPIARSNVPSSQTEVTEVRCSDPPPIHPLRGER